VVLYGCATRSLALREEHRLGCFIPGCWGKHLAQTDKKWQDFGENLRFHNLYSLPTISRMMK
jgi:hypothetical protein